MKKTLLLLLAIACAPCRAEPLAERPALSIGFYEAGLEYSDGKGIDADVIDELARRGGYVFLRQDMPRARIWSQLAGGKLAMATSGVETAERGRFAEFIPYIAQSNRALTLDGRYPTPASLLADPAARVAVVRGFAYGNPYDGLIARLRARGAVTEVPDTQSLFLMLARGHAQLVISIPVFYLKYLKENGLEERVRIYDWQTQQPPVLGCLVLSKTLLAATERAQLRKLVAQMKQDGTLRRIFSRYLPADEVEKALMF
ncbi:ABC transporter substrate-binding protein [Chromobacterium sp. IIBBL 290-4]|uniref:substrate-binding periplasmic protein n=1 Tax=Chromobacterium sp. IIBBL 290-4 TaxID=2953890 RepID=UPI0020B8178C|nr:transporter substrate-binding domain-containing protein [Chromobacterium sp. IIBBL 290-4]UTH76225.1 transporter substrate-binding domain-containing protein [Chromobacterium sp. IIBBL 290-4]